MSFIVTKSAGPCGATVSGLDLSVRLSKKTITELRQIWLEHKVLAFPDQAMNNTDLEKFTRYFGDFGDDPYFEPIDGHDHIAAICRRADETAPVFAEVWHTDWSFQKVPPAGTCLYGITIPPVGGQTLFIDQQKALNEMPHELRARIEGKWAIHSARGGYAPDGAYGEREKDSDRSMKIIYSQDAYATQAHPFIRQHPETGEETLYGILGYIIAVQDMPEEQAKQLLADLFQWQTREQFQYVQKWSTNMLLMWDNRSVLHSASGGYDGYNRLLHRTTIAEPSDASC